MEGLSIPRDGPEDLKGVVMFKKIDDNQTRIVEALRRIGASVLSLASIGRGCPDLLVGLRGVNHLLEVKDAKGELTALQRPWFKAWRGRVSVVRSPEEAICTVMEQAASGRKPDGIEQERVSGVHSSPFRR